MRKNLILLTLIILLPHLGWTQYYIELTKQNVAHYDSSYLIDIPLNHSGNLFIQDTEKLIPINIYYKIWSDMGGGQNLFRLDTIFIVGKESIWKDGIDINILKSSTIPYFSGRYYGSPKPDDTLEDADDRFKEYKKLYDSKLYKKKDSVLIYFVESYGSSCCPRDTRYENKLKLEDFIKAFEEEHRTKIGKYYGVGEGDEGEASVYFTLSGLTSKQKLQFIAERRLSLLPDTLKDKNDTTSEIYTPFWMSMKYLKNGPMNEEPKTKEKPDPNMIYIAVEVEPRFPGGQAAFMALFNSITFESGIKTIITFVVQKNGRLTNVKFLRGGNEKVDLQVKDIIQKSPKWIPGKQNNKKVKVQYTAVIHENQ